MGAVYCRDDPLPWQPGLYPENRSQTSKTEQPLRREDKCNNNNGISADMAL